MFYIADFLQILHSAQILNSLSGIPGTGGLAGGMVTGVFTAFAPDFIKEQYYQAVEDWRQARKAKKQEISNKRKGNSQKMERRFGLKNLFSRWNKYKPNSLEELKKLVNDPKIKLSQIDVSKVDSFEGLFKNSTRTDFSGIESWDVSHVTNMKECFFNCQNFNANISSWDMSNAKSVAKMFAYAKNFDQDLKGWKFDSLKGRYNGKLISSMFKGADRFQKHLYDRYKEILSWDIKEDNLDAIYANLPLPRPKDYKKLVIVPTVEDSVGLLFEKVKNLSTLDTSAVKKLDHVLENSDDHELQNFNTLDLDNVKSAQNLMAGSKISYAGFNSLPNLEYGNGMFKYTVNFKGKLPELDNVKTLDHVLEENKTCVEDIKPLLGNTELKSAEHIFKNSNVSYPNADTLEPAKQKNLSFIKKCEIKAALDDLNYPNMLSENRGNIEETLTDLNEKINAVDPNHDFVAVMIGAEERKEIVDRLPHLKKTLDELSIEESMNSLCNNLNPNDFFSSNRIGDSTFIISKKDYQQILELDKLHNSFTNSQTNVRDAVVKFELNDFVEKFKLENGIFNLAKVPELKDYLSKNENIGGFNVSEHLPLLKRMELINLHSSEDISDWAGLVKSEELLVKKLQNIVKTPEGKRALDHTIHMFSKSTDDFNSKNNLVFKKIENKTKENFGKYAIECSKYLYDTPINADVAEKMYDIKNIIIDLNTPLNIYWDEFNRKDNKNSLSGTLVNGAYNPKQYENRDIRNVVRYGLKIANDIYNGNEVRSMFHKNKTKQYLDKIYNQDQSKKEQIHTKIEITPAKKQGRSR